MTEYWILVAIGILTIISTIFSSMGNIIDKRRKWWRRLKFNGYAILFSGICIIGLGFWQFKLIKNSEAAKDDIIKTEIQNGVNSIKMDLFHDLSEAFAEQGIQLDSISNLFEGLRDSVKTVVVNSPVEDPIIVLRHNSISYEEINSDIKFKISLTTLDESAKMNQLKYFCVLNANDNRIHKTRTGIFPVDGFIFPKEQNSTVEFIIHEAPDFESINIALFGSYSNRAGDQIIEHKELYEYNLKTGVTSMKSHIIRDEIFKKYNLN